MGSIHGPNTCHRQHLVQELYWWNFSQKCVGLVFPPQSQLPSSDKQGNLNSNIPILATTDCPSGEKPGIAEDPEYPGTL